MKLHTHIYGTGKAVVLVHGFCEDSFIWDGIVGPLSQDFKVITVDLAGFGQSPVFKTQPSLGDYATALQTTLDDLGIGKHLLIGHSLGGYIGIEYARLYQKNLTGLGMVHSNVFADTAEKKEARTKSISFIKAHGAEAFARTMFGNLFASENKEQMSSFMEKMAERVRNTPPQAIIHAQIAMRERLDNSEALKMLQIPVMFIAGKQDNSTVFSRSVEQAQIPKEAICYFWENVGHMGMFEKPLATQWAICQFAQYCVSEHP